MKLPPDRIVQSGSRSRVRYFNIQSGFPQATSLRLALRAAEYFDALNG
jgi:hypothetical protein